MLGKAHVTFPAKATVSGTKASMFKAFINLKSTLKNFDKLY